MINLLHKWLHSPSAGWDPVSAEHAAAYAAAHPEADAALVAAFSQAVGGLVGKRVLDLGSGVGQYGLAFASAGAHVTCLDVSRRYLEMARSRFAAAGLPATFVLSYLDDICRNTSGQFDAIFNNICWYYCVSDFSFARAVVRALSPDGVAFIRTNTSAFGAGKSGRAVLEVLYRRFGLKVGHPYPPPGRLLRAFRSVPGCTATETGSTRELEIVVVRRK